MAALSRTGPTLLLLPSSGSGRRELAAARQPAPLAAAAPSAAAAAAAAASAPLLRRCPSRRTASSRPARLQPSAAAADDGVGGPADGAPAAEAPRRGKAFWARLLGDCSRLAQTHLWPLLAVHCLADAAVFLLHRISHRLTNQGARARAAGRPAGICALWQPGSRSARLLAPAPPTNLPRPPLAQRRGPCCTLISLK